MNRSTPLTFLSGFLVLSVLTTSPVKAEFSYIAPDLQTAAPVMTSDGLNLDLAVGKIIPDGFVVFYGSNVSRSEKIQWKSGKPWPVALKEALKGAGLQYTRNGTRISISKALVPKTLMPKTLVSKTQISKTPAPTRSWAVKKGERLSAILERWGQKAGVRVQFLTDRDWLIATDYQFIGTFENATKSLLGALSTSNPAPAAKLTNNRQLLIIRHSGTMRAPRASGAAPAMGASPARGAKVEIETGASEVNQ